MRLFGSAPGPTTNLPAICGAPLPKEPSLAQEAVNLAAALSEWASAGFPVADVERVMVIKEKCEQCSLWDATARAGLGRCKSFKCGCTKFKWWIKTSRCPEGKW